VQYANNQFYVFWQDLRFCPSDRSTFAARLTIDGAFDKLNPDVKVVRIDSQGVVLDTGVIMGSGNERPDIAYDGERCLVVWSREFYGVLGRFVNASGQPEAQEFLITLTQGTSTVPLVEYGDTNYLVVWPDFCQAGTDLDIFGQVVSTSGQLLGERIAIAQGATIQNYPAVAFDGNAFVVAWVEDASIVCGRYISAYGMPMGPAFTISDSTTHERQSASAGAGVNKFLVAWNEYREAFDIYGNMDIATTAIEETTTNVPYQTLFLQTSGIKRYLSGNKRLYNILGMHVSTDNITPGVYFVEECREKLLKVVVIR
jgi:hypothetical protein